jgi:hypothetical protein
MHRLLTSTMTFAAAALAVACIGWSVLPVSAQTTIELLPLTNVWRYDQGGTNLGSGWTATHFNDDAWPVGAALLCNETNTLPAPKNTLLSLTNPGGTRIITYYFRAGFHLPVPVSHVQALVVSNLIQLVAEYA